jgi:uncharacterized protein YfbU (UPF0304 family)
MTREELIELALLGSQECEADEEATNMYVDLAEHLITRGHANTITEIDTILEGMSVEDASNILEIIENGSSLEEGHKEIATGEEMDAEGYMLLRQLSTVEEALNRIRTYIGGDGMMQLPSWVQAKMAVAASDIDTVADYLLSDGGAD